ncbi:MAG: hypothetical protein OES32_03705 [Acidobacteriota bacterium]|nr:hypothetical protein [Acidobacteriota bacterium]
MVVRTQITLDSELRASAREKAALLGISFAEYVRRLVARDLAEDTPAADVEAVFALGDSGGSDVARDKDEMIGLAAAMGRRD